MIQLRDMVATLDRRSPALRPPLPVRGNSSPTGGGSFSRQLSGGCGISGFQPITISTVVLKERMAPEPNTAFIKRVPPAREDSGYAEDEDDDDVMQYELHGDTTHKRPSGRASSLAILGNVPAKPAAVRDHSGQKSSVPPRHMMLTRSKTNPIGGISYVRGVSMREAAERRPPVPRTAGFRFRQPEEQAREASGNQFVKPRIVTAEDGGVVGYIDALKKRGIIKGNFRPSSISGNNRQFGQPDMSLGKSDDDSVIHLVQMAQPPTQKSNEGAASDVADEREEPIENIRSPMIIVGTEDPSQAEIVAAETALTKQELTDSSDLPACLQETLHRLMGGKPRPKSAENSEHTLFPSVVSLVKDDIALLVKKGKDARKDAHRPPDPEKLEVRIDQNLLSESDASRSDWKLSSASKSPVERQRKLADFGPLRVWEEDKKAVRKSSAVSSVSQSSPDISRSPSIRFQSKFSRPDQAEANRENRELKRKLSNLKSDVKEDADAFESKVEEERLRLARQLEKQRRKENARLAKKSRDEEARVAKVRATGHIQDAFRADKLNQKRVNKAARRIQRWYRGERLRKELKEAREKARARGYPDFGKFYRHYLDLMGRIQVFHGLLDGHVDCNMSHFIQYLDQRKVYENALRKFVGQDRIVRPPQLNQALNHVDKYPNPLEIQRSLIQCHRPSKSENYSCFSKFPIGAAVDAVFFIYVPPFIGLKPHKCRKSTWVAPIIGDLELKKFLDDPQFLAREAPFSKCLQAVMDMEVERRMRPAEELFGPASELQSVMPLPSHAA